MRQRHLFLAVAAVSLTAACSPTPEAPPTAAQMSTAHASHAGMIRVTNNGDLTAEQKQAIAQVKQVTERFHDIAIATRPTSQGGGGYTQQFPVGREQAEERPRRRGKVGSEQMPRCLVVGRRHNRGEKMSGGSGGARRSTPWASNLC